MAQISLTGIDKSFGQTSVLKGVDLNVEQGEFVTLVGPSGCGKSTLLRILAGLESPDQGRVEIAGKDVTSIRPAARNLAMVFQSYALYPHLTVRENMLTPLKLRDVGRIGRLPVVGPMFERKTYADLLEQVSKTAKTLQIEALLDRKPGQLSGGQRQRAALGRAMVRDPVAFLMDEPLSNLDAALRVHMRAELSDLHRRLNTTFVYVTHDQAEALTMSSRMAVMMGGRILQFGAPDEIYRAPNSLEVAQFVGSPTMNLLPGEIDGAGRIDVRGAILPVSVSLPAQPVSVGVRAEHLSLDSEGPFEGRLTHFENLGSDLFLHLGMSNTDRPIVLRTKPGVGLELSIGAYMRFSLEPTRLHLFDGSGRRLGAHLNQMMEVA